MPLLVKNYMQLRCIRFKYSNLLHFKKHFLAFWRI